MRIVPKLIGVLLVLALCSGCGSQAQPPQAADVRPAIESLLADIKTARRHLGSDLAQATAYHLDSLTEVRQVGMPQPSDRPDRWRVRVAVSGAYTATLALAPTELPMGPQQPPTRTVTTSAMPPGTHPTATQPNAAPVKSQVVVRQFAETFDVYLARDDGGVWRVP